jgi:hypothetical protein
MVMTRIFLVLITIVFLFACKKESFITSPDAALIISEDTLHFDTVFTTTGSVTHLFKIFNPNDQKIKIDKVNLEGGIQSPFKINADGFAGPEVLDLEIRSNDSLYVFVTVIVDPVTGNLPFVVRDSIEITYNGNTRQVQLEAFGQNAHIMRNLQIMGNETWTNDLPYVILGSLHVTQNAQLTIEKGTRIFVHADAPLVIDGTLLINGDKDSVDRVHFQGDRLDEPYRDFPASWPGIYFRSTSKDNVINYAVIKNAYQAIAATGLSVNTNPKIKLNQVIIDNAYDAGIIAIHSSIEAVNCLVSNSGKNVYLAEGGQYTFTHCTIASYSNLFIQHTNPVLYVSNFTNVNNVITSNDLQAQFTNCIFWGDFGLVEDEAVVAKNGNTIFDVNFNHGILKVKTDPANASLNQMINQDPLFDTVNTSSRIYNFRLRAGSPAIDKGIITSVNIDLDGLPRPVGLPDLGAFEKQ